MPAKASISLIISTYNNTRYLKLVLLSIMQQKVMPDEVIIADDGSTKDTENLINEFKSKLLVPLIHVWHKDDGYRLSVIKNKAAAKSSCDFIFFLDGDLLLHPLFVSDIKNNIQKNIFLVASRAFISQEHSDLLVSNIPNSFHFRLSHFEKNALSAFRLPWLHNLIKGSTTYKGARGGLMGLFRSDYIAVNGFDESYKGWGREDSDLFVRLINYGLKRKNLKFCAITYHLWHRILSRDSLSKNDILLEKTIEEKRTTCSEGISQYLI